MPDPFVFPDSLQAQFVDPEDLLRMQTAMSLILHASEPYKAALLVLSPLMLIATQVVVLSHSVPTLEPADLAARIEKLIRQIIRDYLSGDVEYPAGGEAVDRSDSNLYAIYWLTTLISSEISPLIEAPNPIVADTLREQILTELQKTNSTN